jgi:hypothetical protein
MTRQIAFLLGVLVFATGVLIIEKVRPDPVALAVMLCLDITRLITPHQDQSFENSASLTAPGVWSRKSYGENQLAFGLVFLCAARERQPDEYGVGAAKSGQHGL